MISQVWTYSSGLEKESSRFSQPGDFFTYIIFLGLVILVRSNTTLYVQLVYLLHSLLSWASLFFCISISTPHISARPAII